MKTSKIGFLMISVFSGSSFFGQQNLIEPTGKVGIGTTSPKYTLDIRGNLFIDSNIQVNGSTLILNDFTSSGAVRLTGLENANGKGQLSNVMIDSDGKLFRLPGLILDGDKLPQGPKCLTNANNHATWKAGVNKLYVDCPDVNVGINTDDPQFKLDVIGPAKSQYIYVGTSPYDPVYGKRGSYYNNFLKGHLLISGTNSSIGFRSDEGGVSSNINGDIAMRLVDRQSDCGSTVRGLTFFRPGSTTQNRPSSNYDLFISSSSETAGNIGIGTEKAKYRLTVEGKIGAREIIVEQKSWCDYVFDENYKLRTLGEVEEFIKSNKHLPGVPSASEVSEDGIQVSEMTKILMEKIEELTLYQIELEKKLQEQNLKIEQLINETKK
ncbi:MAG: hypothetical protein EP338_07930 [Bacteroidetes bacterium]|nr:MAG: hypothetical protein EP338_07930 [Bacteroidota bacterium]